jgi:hypothetical protein
MAALLTVTRFGPDLGGQIDPEKCLTFGPVSPSWYCNDCAQAHFFNHFLENENAENVWWNSRLVGFHSDSGCGWSFRDFPHPSSVEYHNATTGLSAFTEDTIMRHTNLYVKVGRASPKPVCTVDVENPQHDFLIDQNQRRSFDALLASGVDAARIEFSEETVDVPETETPKATVKKVRGGK